MPRAVIICLVCLAGPVVFADGDFPPITDAERALDAVPGQPDAPAVVLFRKGEFKLRSHPASLPSEVYYGRASRREVSSCFRVNVRLKILTEDGERTHGVQHFSYASSNRLEKVDGRTVLPDGRIVPLPEDAVFHERLPDSPHVVTRMVFPAVEVGAILDYEYTLRYDHPLAIPTWYFQGALPTRRSEITYIVPPNLSLRTSTREVSEHPIRGEVQDMRGGQELRLWSEGLPGIHREPHGLPAADLWSRVVIVPTAIRLRGQRLPLLDSWESACRLYIDRYRAVRRSDRQARRKARELAERERSRLEKIAAVHAFVRDEIETDVAFNIEVAADANVDAVLAAGRGRPVVKALVLQSMLAALDVDSDLVWVADRMAGRVDFDAPVPWWFDAALVRVEVDGGPLYLDPFDRSVGLGHIALQYEGTRGLIVHPTTPEIVELPSSPFEHNLRRAVVDLEIGDDGRVEGRGTLELGGHQAGSYLRLKDAEAVAVQVRWWLATRFEGYDISDVEAEQDIRRQRVRVGWSLERPAKEALGDEVTVQPSLPLGPETQPFTLAPSLRKTTVRLEFGLRDDLVLTLRWPPGWEVDVLPEHMAHHGTAGKVECRVELDEVQRSITFRRRFELTGREFVTRDSYAALRDLYEQASAADAQNLVLVRRNPYR